MNLESSTVPDTQEGSSERNYDVNAVARGIAADNRILGDFREESEKTFIAITKSGLQVTDWTFDQIASLGPRFKDAPNEELFNKVNNDLIRSYTITKEYNTDKRAEGNNQMDALISANSHNPVIAEMFKAEKVQLNKYYDVRDSENKSDFDDNKDQLLLVADRDRNQNPNVLEQPSNEKTSQVSNSQSSSEAPQERLPQDSSEVVQTEFSSFEPFDE